MQYQAPLSSVPSKPREAASPPQHPPDTPGMGWEEPPSVLCFGRNSPKGCGVAEGVLDRRDISKGAFYQAEKELRALAGSWRKVHSEAPNGSQTKGSHWDQDGAFFWFGGKMRQRVSSGPSSLGSGVIPEGFPHSPAGSRTVSGAGQVQVAFPLLIQHPQPCQALGIPFTPKGNWSNPLTSSIPARWQTPSTDLVTHRLCSQGNDLGIEGLSSMGPQPNSSKSTKPLMIPDSWNQSLGAENLFNLFPPPHSPTSGIKQNCSAQVLLSTNH